MLNVFSLDFTVAQAPCRLLTINSHEPAEPSSESSLQHRHSGCELHYVSAGELTVDCIGASYRLCAGQALLIPSGLYHYIRSLSRDVDRMDMLLEIGKGGSAQADQLLQGLFQQRALLLDESGSPEVFALFRKLRQVTDDRRKSQFLRAQWLKVLSAQLVLLLAEQIPGSGEQAEYARQLPDVDRYIIDQFFNHNYHGNSDLRSLAVELNLSVRQTDRVLHRIYGKGFREKMNECRLAVALDLLRNTDKSMTQISEILGYGGPTNFSAFIKKQTGKTPAQIRREK